MAELESAAAPVANVSRFLDQMSERRGDRPALLAPRGRIRSGEIDYLSLSFAELRREQDNWCRHLREAGVGRGTRVLLAARPGLPLIAVCFALFKLGAVPIVIDPGMGLKSFFTCVKRSSPKVLIGTSLAIWVSRIFPAAFRTVTRKIKLGGGLSRAPIAKESGAFQGELTKSNDLAAILFTSGSTGPAKGVCYEHGMFEAQVIAIGRQYGIEEGEVDLPMLPIFALFNPALGMTTVIPEINPSKPATVDPAKIIQAIRQCDVTNSFGSPVLWKKIGGYCQANGITLPSLRRILMAGASVPPHLFRDFKEILPQGVVHSPYGATEILPVSSIDGEQALKETAELTERGRGTCVGKPLPGVEVRIAKISDDWLGKEALGDAVPLGDVGEIIVSGPSVTREYDNLPEATNRSKIRTDDRIWHRMGDLGYLDEKGRLWFCGRLAERIQIGKKTYLTDCCEGVFNTLPKVCRSALVSLEKDGERVPCIAIQPREGSFPKTRLERNRFIEGLKKAAAITGMTGDIREFVFTKSFPVDVRHNAKINRIELARLLRQEVAD